MHNWSLFSLKTATIPLPPNGVLKTKRDNWPPSLYLPTKLISSPHLQQTHYRTWHQPHYSKEKTPNSISSKKPQSAATNDQPNPNPCNTSHSNNNENFPLHQLLKFRALIKYFTYCHVILHFSSLINFLMNSIPTILKQVLYGVLMYKNKTLRRQETHMNIIIKFNLSILSYFHP